MTFGTASRFRLFSCLLALLWILLPVLSAAQCVHALPPSAATRPAKGSTTARCPMCAKMSMAGMQMPNRQMPGMAGMKCCCRSGNAPMSCRCGIQPQPKPAAVILALVWSPHTLLPVQVRVLPPVSSLCTYSAFFVHLLMLCRTPLPRPPRLL